ncbi:hypothetical protein N7495_002795 [Penicillium taxi]|uniref:uncharacterized protein n=1 Tax=Penicillium taxi TaxID=168475 RepID=UPI0025456825|nr:uncharacterized protein N7495_002795 [Penicillium taxi]KAJ5902267.1 hypothetical protein N7495_002795 [Penicillium taxi]
MSCDAICCYKVSSKLPRSIYVGAATSVLRCWLAMSATGLWTMHEHLKYVNPSAESQKENVTK